ncbi:MAG TPA: NAD(P)H-dependent oxidoreductase [Paucimonas sp.]|nr:NAD(P)H-dependent oxidoreductase [Paucimonas sp.]
MPKRILVLNGHPDPSSFCASLATAYAASAHAASHEVITLQLSEQRFDPVLRRGYHAEQELESDLASAQRAIAWAEHLVFVYPVWWGAMPALLKGFIDRTFLPGFAFKYRPNSSLWDKLLAGRSADLIVTMDTPLWYYRWVQRMPGHHQMKKTILEFCGVEPVRITSFGPVRGSSNRQRERWIARTEQLAHSI